MITVYTKDNCPACVSLKATLKQEGKPFKEINIGKDITREDFMRMFPTVRTVPYMVMEGSVE
jgi:glutaredoxin